MSAPLTRRTALFGALTSSAALAVPVTAAVHSEVQGKLDRLMAIENAALEWVMAVKSRGDAMQAYEAAVAALPPLVRLEEDAPVRSAWIDADEEATRTKWKLLNLIADAAGRTA